VNERTVICVCQLRWQLKPNLPQFCHITRSFRSVSVTSLNSCSVAECLYVSLSSCPAAHTGRQRMSNLRKVNLEYRECEQLQDISRHKRARKDVSVRAQEQTRDTSAHKRARSVAYVRTTEQSHNTCARHESRKNEDARGHENLLKSVRQNPGRGCISVGELITQFHNVVSQGAVYVRAVHVISCFIAMEFRWLVFS